jgi:hypothetical protein
MLFLYTGNYFFLKSILTNFSKFEQNDRQYPFKISDPNCLNLIRFSFLKSSRFYLHDFTCTFVGLHKLLCEIHLCSRAKVNNIFLSVSSLTLAFTNMTKIRCQEQCQSFKIFGYVNQKSTRVHQILEMSSRVFTDHML